MSVTVMLNFIQAWSHAVTNLSNAG